MDCKGCLNFLYTEWTISASLWGSGGSICGSVAGKHHSCRTLHGKVIIAELQDIEIDETYEAAEMLMECWDSPTSVEFSHVVHFYSPLFETRVYADGAFIARQGDAATHTFYLKEGEVLVHSVPQHSESLSGSETEADDVSHM